MQLGGILGCRGDWRMGRGWRGEGDSHRVELGEGVLRVVCLSYYRTVSYCVHVIHVYVFFLFDVVFCSVLLPLIVFQDIAFVKSCEYMSARR